MADLFADRTLDLARHRCDGDRWPDRPCRISQWRFVHRYGRAPLEGRGTKHRDTSGELALDRRMAGLDGGPARSALTPCPQRTWHQRGALPHRFHAGRRKLGRWPAHRAPETARRLAATQDRERRHDVLRPFLLLQQKHATFTWRKRNPHRVLQGFLKLQSLV